jgi:RHS repeat-associated protein
VHDDLDYYPFGDTYTNFGSSPSTEHYLFTGDEKDAETSTSFAQARNLSGSLGRFHRPDPYDGSYDFTNPQSLNRYAYVSNRPTILSDPSGKQCVWDDGSYDDEHDPVTGDVAACQSQGGTWIELGQNADWSPSQNGNLQAVVGNIQSGRWAGVNYGGNYTFYSTAPGQTGLVTATDTGGALTFYGYSPMTGVNAINMGSYSDPNQAAGAAVFSTYILSTLDPNDNNAYIRQLSAQVYGNVTHPFGETYQDACNGYLQLEGGVLTGAFAPEVLGASAGYTSVAATRLSVTNALMGSGMTAAGTMGVCDAF